MILPDYVYVPGFVADAVERRLDQFRRSTGAVFPIDYGKGGSDQ